jgi:hypothetical protein
MDLVYGSEKPHHCEQRKDAAPNPEITPGAAA